MMVDDDLRDFLWINETKAMCCTKRFMMGASRGQPQRASWTGQGACRLAHRAAGSSSAAWSGRWCCPASAADATGARPEPDPTAQTPTD